MGREPSGAKEQVMARERIQQVYCIHCGSTLDASEIDLASANVVVEGDESHETEVDGCPSCYDASKGAK
jgi:hypothetical protein